jgi:hypothetical protein
MRGLIPTAADRRPRRVSGGEAPAGVRLLRAEAFGPGCQDLPGSAADSLSSAAHGPPRRRWQLLRAPPPLHTRNPLPRTTFSEPTVDTRARLVAPVRETLGYVRASRSRNPPPPTRRRPPRPNPPRADPHHSQASTRRK